MNIEDKYKQLLDCFDRAYLTPEELLAHYPELGITNPDHLINSIRDGAIKLRYTRLRDARKAKPVFFLRDVATWLHSIDPSTTQTAADQAA